MNYLILGVPPASSPEDVSVGCHQFPLSDSESPVALCFQILVEWASALVPPTPLCGGRRAGSVNKTTGEAKTIINDHIPSRVMEEKINSEAES